MDGRPEPWLNQLTKAGLLGSASVPEGQADPAHWPVGTGVAPVSLLQKSSGYEGSALNRAW